MSSEGWTPKASASFRTVLGCAPCLPSSRRQIVLWETPARRPTPSTRPWDERLRLLRLSSRTSKQGSSSVVRLSLSPANLPDPNPPTWLLSADDLSVFFYRNHQANCGLTWGSFCTRQPDRADVHPPARFAGAPSPVAGVDSMAGSVGIARTTPQCRVRLPLLRSDPRTLTACCALLALTGVGDRTGSSPCRQGNRVCT